MRFGSLCPGERASGGLQAKALRKIHREGAWDPRVARTNPRYPEHQSPERPPAPLREEHRILLAYHERLASIQKINHRFRKRLRTLRPDLVPRVVHKDQTAVR
jgi:hypothetical protein